MTKRHRRLGILYFEAGSGHMTAARALRRGLEPALGEGWSVDLIDAVDLFEPGSKNDQVMRQGIDEFNDQMRREKVFDLRGRVNLGRLFNDSLMRRGLPEMIRAWHRIGAPDALVSVTPIYNGAVCRSLRCVKPNAAYVTIPVDFEEFKRRYWFDTRNEQDYLCAKPKLAAQALERGVDASRIRRLGGMIVSSEFYERAGEDRGAWLERHGLEPDRPLVLAHFGAQGSEILATIAAELDACREPIQAIFLCGRSDAIRARVEQTPTRYPKIALGFTEQAPSVYYQMADVLIGKPGAMTITEALVSETPILAIKATGMAPVQRGNERWVEQEGTGIVVAKPAKLADAMSRVLREPASFARAIERASHRGIDDAVAAIVDIVR